MVDARGEPFGIMVEFVKLVVVLLVAAPSHLAKVHFGMALRAAASFFANRPRPSGGFRRGTSPSRPLKCGRD